MRAKYADMCAYAAKSLATASARSDTLQPPLQYPTVHRRSTVDRSGFGEVTAVDIGKTLTQSLRRAASPSESSGAMTQDGTSYQVQVEGPATKNEFFDQEHAHPAERLVQQDVTARVAGLAVEPHRAAVGPDVAKVIRRDHARRERPLQHAALPESDRQCRGRGPRAGLDRVDGACAERTSCLRGVEVDLGGQVKPCVAIPEPGARARRGGGRDPDAVVGLLPIAAEVLVGRATVPAVLRGLSLPSGRPERR